MTKPPAGPLAVAAAAVAAVVAVAVVLATPAVSALRASVPRGDVTILVREDVKDLTPAQKAAIVAAVKKSKTVPSPWKPSISYYDQFVLWHR